MKLIIAIVVCFLLSGCGLFNKTKRVDRQLDAVEVSKSVILSTDTQQETVDKSVSNENKTEETHGQLKVYPKPGTSVTVGPDGSVTGEVDSVINNVRQKSKEAKNLVKDVKDNLQKKQIVSHYQIVQVKKRHLPSIRKKSHLLKVYWLIIWDGVFFL